MAECPTVTRAKLADRLRSEGRVDLVQVLSKCAEVITMQCVCCRDTMTVERGCAKRWCPVCAPKITAKRHERMSRLVCRFQWPLSTTLTTRNTADSEGCIEAMKERFRSFRRTDFWRTNSRGGVYAFEITNTGKGYHPHVHILHDCEWLAVATPRPTRGAAKKHVAALCKRAQNELSEVWGAYVQGSKASVHCERAWGKALAETLKYAIKPSDLLECKCYASSIIDEMDRGRLIGTFGHAHACSKDFVGLEEVIIEEHQCEECESRKSIVPESALVRMMERPEKLKEHWRELLRERFKRQLFTPEEIKNAMNEPDEKWMPWEDDEE